MKEEYWFRTHHSGLVWYPASWQGWVILLSYFGILIYSFIQINAISHSTSDTLITFVPRFFIFSLLLLSITYLKGEPRKKKI